MILWPVHRGIACPVQRAVTAADSSQRWFSQELIASTPWGSGPSQAVSGAFRSMNLSSLNDFVATSHALCCCTRSIGASISVGNFVASCAVLVPSDCPCIHVPVINHAQMFPAFVHLQCLCADAAGRIGAPHSSKRVCLGKDGIQTEFGCISLHRFDPLQHKTLEGNSG